MSKEEAHINEKITKEIGMITNDLNCNFLDRYKHHREIVAPTVNIANLVAAKNWGVL